MKMLIKALMLNGLFFMIISGCIVFMSA